MSPKFCHRKVLVRRGWLGKDRADLAKELSLQLHIQLAGTPSRRCAPSLQQGSSCLYSEWVDAHLHKHSLFLLEFSLSSVLGTMLMKNCGWTDLQLF